MKCKFPELSRRYQQALCRHLSRTPPAGVGSAHGLGSDLVAAGLPLLELARLHEHTLATEILPGQPGGRHAAVVRKAGLFFAAALVPTTAPATSRHPVTATLKNVVAALSQRTVELAASNFELKREISHRRVVEAALKKSERHHSRLLQHSDQLQDQLPGLSRQILSAQEDERRRISCELHDVIAQTLTGINVRLAALKKAASLNSQRLDRSIEQTRRLVEESVGFIHRFARELRPAVLDDLGVIPALHSFLETFTERTGIRTRLTAFAGVEPPDITRRTVLVRVAQEALSNVERHAPRRPGRRQPPPRTRKDLYGDHR